MFNSITTDKNNKVIYSQIKNSKLSIEEYLPLKNFSFLNYSTLISINGVKCNVASSDVFQ